jgi:hypothetical protein
MTRKKAMWERGGIVFDPNIQGDWMDDDERSAKKKYMGAKGKRKKYLGI